MCLSEFKIKMIEINIFKHKIWNGKSLSKAEIKKIVNECFIQTNSEIRNVFLNVSFVNSKLIRELNFKYRGKNNITNVLSFEDKFFNVKNNNKMLFGDIALCYEQIKEEASKFNKQFKDRLYHMFVHGILHLFGYDHVKYKDRKEMEMLEKKILSKFKIVDPYFYYL